MRLKTTDLYLQTDTKKLVTQIQDLFSRTNQQVNGITEGTGSAFHAARTSVPTSGTWASGDFVKNSNYTQSGKYTLIGWARVTNGSANVLGTDWMEVNTANASLGWRDLIGDAAVKGTAGANTPTWAVYRGSLYQYQFSKTVMNEMWFNYHLDHDFKPADCFIHVHWSQIVVDTGGTAGVPGVAKWYFDVSYAKGHQQAAFSAPITTSVTQQGSTTQYMHNIAEVQLSADSPSASQLANSILETDGILIVRLYRNPVDAADTLNQEPFVHTVDIHYQSDRTTTANKAFPFN